MTCGPTLILVDDPNPITPVEVQVPGPPGPPGQAAASVANRAAVAALGASAWASGTQVWSRAALELWVLDRDSAAAADGVTVLAATVGRWLRRIDFGHPRWAAQTSWFIDSANPAASDENDGATAQTPLATPAEYVRRVGYRRVLAPSQTVTITIVGSYDATSPLAFIADGTANEQLLLVGTPVLLTSGTTTDVSQQDAGNSGYFKIVSAGFDFSPYVDKLVRFKNVSGSDYEMFISANLSQIGYLGAAIATLPVRTLPSSQQSGGPPPNNQIPIGSRFEIYDVASLATLGAECNGISFSASYLDIGALSLKGDGNPTLASCIVEGGTVAQQGGTVWFQNCDSTNGNVQIVAGSIAHVDAGQCGPVLGTGCTLSLENFAILLGGALSPACRLVNNTGMSVTNSIALPFGANIEILGPLNGAYSGALFECEGANRIAFGSFAWDGFTAVGQSPAPWGMISIARSVLQFVPYDPATNAYAAGNAPISVTPTAFAAAFGPAGFSFNVIDLANDVRMWRSVGV